MKRYLALLRYLFSMYLTGLALLTLCRIILYLQGFSLLADEPHWIRHSIQAFLRGIWMDNVIACYILIVPLIVTSVCASAGYYGKRLYQGIQAFFCLFYTVAFMIASGDIPYFDYFFKHLNASIFNWAEYAGTTLGLMFGEFSYLMAVLLFVVMTLLYGIAANSYLHTARRVFDRKTPNRWQSAAGIIGCSALLIGGCLFGIRGRMGYNPIRVSAAYFCNNTFLNQLGVSPAFNLLKSAEEMQKSENREIHLMDDTDAIRYVRNALHLTDSLPHISPIARTVTNAPCTGKRNVVFIFMESMSANLMGHFGDRRQLTPFLDSIADHSLCFNRFYSSGTHTNHAIHSVLYSYPALMKRNSMKGSVIPFYTGLPTVLQDNGYHTLFFMTHESQYDNMNGFLRTNGFDQIYAQEDYPREKRVNSFGVSDEYLYEFALRKLNEEAAGDSPFFASLLSISNHPPYIIPEGFKSRNSADDERIVEFADHALRVFMDQAAQQPWFDNTIFVFFGDHGRRSNILRSDMPLTFNHIPFMIYAPEWIEPQQTDRIGGQIDIAPTLLGLLGIDYTDNGLGINLLREERDCIFFTSDDAIGCIDREHFFIHKPATDQSWLLHVNGYTEQDPVDAPEKEAALREYAFSFLQAAQYLMSNNLTGKYIGYQPK